MNKNIMPKLVCPICKGKLNWSISKLTSSTIISAKINCSKCNNTFFLEDGILNFITNKSLLENDHYYKLQKAIENLDEIKKQELLKTPIEELNESDQYFKVELLYYLGLVEDANWNKLFQQSNKHEKDYCDTISNQFKHSKLNLDYSDKFILDLATGRGAYLKYLLKNTNLNFVCVDISKVALNRLKDELIDMNAYNRVSLVICDAQNLPFENNCFNSAISLYSLMHIPDWKKFSDELFRVVSKQFVSIENFEIIDSSNYIKSIKNNFEKWTCIDFQNIKVTNMCPTEKGKIIPFRINTYPLQKTEVFNSSIVLKK